MRSFVLKVIQSITTWLSLQNFLLMYSINLFVSPFGLSGLEAKNIKYTCTTELLSGFKINVFKQYMRLISKWSGGDGPMGKPGLRTYIDC